jgi:hypothetical protein
MKKIKIDFGSKQSDAERLKAHERVLRDAITGFRASARLGRDAVHERGP